MKAKFYISTILLIVATSSCKKMLEENTKSYLSNTNFYASASDAVAAINSVYGPLQDDLVFLYYQQLTEVPTDDVTIANATVAARVELENFQYNGTHVSVVNVWKNAYIMISRANVVLSRVPPIVMDSRLKTRILAEARFMRAFAYFRLVRLFGKVPLVLEEVTNPKDIYPKSEEIASIYQAIIEDLKFAEVNLDTKYDFGNPEYGRPTIGSAKSLLANVYLTMAGEPLKDSSKYQLAADKAKEVIDNKSTYGYEMVANVIDLFDYKKESTNTEVVFYSRAFSGYPATSRYFSRMYNLYVTASAFIPTTQIRTLYTTTDDRSKLITSNRRIGKYIDAEHGTDADNDYPLIRYTEVLLTYAESLIEIGGVDNLSAGLAIINQIRARAKLTTPLTVNMSDAAAAQITVRKMLRDERRLELAFEGQRWHDLVRWGTLVPVMQAAGINTVQEKNKVFPIPSIELDVNPNLLPNGY